MLSKTKYLCFLILCLLFGCIFTYYYFLYTHEYPPGSYERIAIYEADKVFQTRLLVTELANLFIQYSSIFETCFNWMLPYPMSYEVILQMINVFFLSGLLMLMPSLMNILNCSLNPFWTLLIMVPISWNYIFINGYLDGAGLYYPYDIPSLTFFALGTILFAKQRWFLFYPVFILACLNRESACFISIAGFLILIDTKSIKLKDLLKNNRKIIIHSFIQASLWFSSRIILSYVFRNNPGEFLESPQSMIDFLTSNESTRHWAGSPNWFITLFAGIWVFPLILFRKLTTKSKRFLMVGAVYLFVLIFRSNMMETRVYNELNIILSACTLACLFNHRHMLQQTQLDA